MVAVSPIMRRFILFAYLLAAVPVFAWTHALEPVVKNFEDKYGIKTRLEAPQNITQSFPLAVQSGKGPDIVIWAHDKVGEWAGAGLISPLDISGETRAKFLPQAWEALTNKGRIWGFPIGLETVTLIYNKKLLGGAPTKFISDLAALDAKIEQEHPGTSGILWDYKSPYYSWGIFAGAGAYIWGKNDGTYNLTDIGVNNAGAIEALSDILKLVKSGILPKSVSYSTAEDKMSQGKLAMMISGPWAWSNLMKTGIDFDVAPVPGCSDKPARPFVGVSAAYINRASDNQDIAREFVEHYLVSEQGLKAMNNAKPIGIPALISLAQQMQETNPLLKEMRSCDEQGEVTPNIPEMGRFWTAFGSALEVATNGRATAQAALQEAAENMRRH